MDLLTTLGSLLLGLLAWGLGLGDLAGPQRGPCPPPPGLFSPPLFFPLPPP